MPYVDGSGPDGRCGWTWEEQTDGSVLIDGDRFERVFTGTIQRGDWGKNGYGLLVPFVSDGIGKQIIDGETVLRPAAPHNRTHVRDANTTESPTTK